MAREQRAHAAAAWRRAIVPRVLSRKAFHETTLVRDLVATAALVDRVEAQVTGREVPLQAPQSRSLHAMAADDARGNVVRSGGADGAIGALHGTMTSDAATAIAGAK